MSANTYYQVMYFDLMKHFFHLLPQALFPGSRLPSSFNLVRPSLPARLARPHEVPPVDLIKTRLQQGDASLRTKSALSVLMRTNLTFLCPVKPVPFAPPHGRSSLPPGYSAFGAAHPHH